jgi:hypothetical protein
MLLIAVISCSAIPTARQHLCSGCRLSVLNVNEGRGIGTWPPYLLVHRRRIREGGGVGGSMPGRRGRRPSRFSEEIPLPFGHWTRVWSAVARAVFRATPLLWQPRKAVSRPVAAGPSGLGLPPHSKTSRTRRNCLTKAAGHYSVNCLYKRDEL